MLLQNLDPKRGLCNGTRLQVKSISKHVVFCTYLDCERARLRASTNGIVLLLCICCRSSEDSSFVKFDRKQFPIRVCFAMTINKSQGQSLGRVGVYLNPEVFSHGQLYVAFSRTTDQNKLQLADDGAGEDADGRGLLYRRVKNIVYNEVFYQLSRTTTTTIYKFICQLSFTPLGQHLVVMDAGTCKAMRTPCGPLVDPLRQLANCNSLVALEKQHEQRRGFASQIPPKLVVYIHVSRRSRETNIYQHKYCSLINLFLSIVSIQTC